MKDLQGKEIILGPTPEVELNLIKAIILQCKPTILVEFGHLEGTSARAILSVIDSTQHLYSFDPYVDTNIIDDRFTFFKVPAEDFKDLGKEVDFLFIDASHNLALNILAWKSIKRFLSKDAIIIIHDTGYWNTDLYTNLPDFINTTGIVSHRPDEIEFVEYIKEAGYNAINFSTTKEYRCGVTILQ